MTSSWAHFVVTWDGTSLLLYKDGAAVAPTSITTDNAGTMVDDARSVSVGCNTSGINNTSGNYHSLAMWSTALSAGEVSTLYNAGDGSTYDAANIQTADLQQYILFGYAAGDLYHNTITSYDIGANQANIDDTDIVLDAP